MNRVLMKKKKKKTKNLVAFFKMHEPIAVE